MADKQFLWQQFQQVDSYQDGLIGPAELQQLLSNSWEPLDQDTCRLLVRIFDKERKGKISFQDLVAVWTCVSDWTDRFSRFDKYGTGINNFQLLTALQSFGFRLPLKTVDTIINRFDKGEGGEGAIYLGDFIHCCAILLNVTNGFKKLDPKNKGEINVKYADFVELVFDSGL